jgi:hypothetical protein
MTEIPQLVVLRYREMSKCKAARSVLDLRAARKLEKGWEALPDNPDNPIIEEEIDRGREE